MPQLARRTLTLLAVCAALLRPTPAAAGPGARARLRYQRLAGAESCPPQPAFQTEIAAWLGYDPFSDASLRSVVIDLSGSTSGLAAHLLLEDSTGKVLGERQILTASPDCRDLTQALVLAVALAVDPLPITRDVISLPITRDVISQKEPAPPPTVQAPAPPPAPAGPVAVAARPRGTNGEVSLQLGGALSLLAGPQPAAGLIAGLEARWNHWSISVAGQGNTFTGQAWAPGSVQVSLVAAELAPCYRLGALGFCGVVAAGAELGHGEGIREASNQTLPYLGAGGRFLYDWHLTGPLSLRGQVEVLGRLLGAKFDVGTTDAWATPAVAVGIAGMLTLRL